MLRAAGRFDVSVQRPRAPFTLLSTRRHRRRSLAVTPPSTPSHNRPRTHDAQPFDVAALLTQKGIIACEENEHANTAPRQANQRQREREVKTFSGGFSSSDAMRSGFDASRITRLWFSHLRPGAAAACRAPPCCALHVHRLRVSSQASHGLQVGSQAPQSLCQLFGIKQLRSSATAESKHRYVFSRGGRDLTVARDAADAPVRRICVALPRSIAVAALRTPPVNNMTRPLTEHCAP